MEAEVLTGKALSIMKVLVVEPAPVSDSWIAYAAWKRKSHLDEKRRLVRRTLRRLQHAGYVRLSPFLYKESRRGVGRVVVRDDCLGWQATPAGYQAMRDE